MDIFKAIETVFPTMDEVPGKFKIPAPVEQRDYVVNGLMHRWDGPIQEVYSPVCVQTSKGHERVYIGSFPLMTEKEAFLALDAAVYRTGRNIDLKSCHKSLHFF